MHSTFEVWDCCYVALSHNDCGLVFYLLYAATMPPFVTCDDGETRCDNGYECLANKYVCDGLEHCSDNSDERGCGKIVLWLLGRSSS